MSDNYLLNDGDTPVLIHAPHGGLIMPILALESLTVSDEELESELLAMTDRHTDTLAARMVSYAYNEGRSQKTAGTMINNLSRLVIDPERFPDEREEMNAVGMGAVYTHGSQRQQIREPDADLEQELINSYFHPYASALEGSATRKLEKYGKAFIIDLHSYSSKVLPYELNQGSPRPEICIGFDSQHCSTEQLNRVVQIFEASGYGVGFNSPFAGTYVPLKYYGKDSRISSIMLEIRRDMYMDEVTGVLNENKATKLITSLGQIIDYFNQM